MDGILRLDGRVEVGVSWFVVFGLPAGVELGLLGCLFLHFGPADHSGDLLQLVPQVLPVLLEGHLLPLLLLSPPPLAVLLHQFNYNQSHPTLLNINTISANQVINAIRGCWGPGSTDAPRPLPSPSPSPASSTSRSLQTAPPSVRGAR